MSVPEEIADDIRAVEALMRKKFRTEPFHNLYLLYSIPQTTLAHGGTCSDKTLSLHQALQGLGVPASLHTAFIRGEEIHRLVSVQLGSRRFFADVGNGWPSIKLYPLDREVSYACYGMRFRSAIQGRRMSIYNYRNGVERHQMDISFDSKPDEQILADIKARFDGGVEYPFSHGIRFSQVVGEEFMFLRDDRLEIYAEDSSCRTISGIDPGQIRDVIEQHFGFDIEVLRAGAPGGAQ